MKLIIGSIILFLMGLITLIINIRTILNKDFANLYIDNSPKAMIQNKMFGKQKSALMTRKIFAPLGIVISIIFILLSLLFWVFKIILWLAEY